MKEIKAVIHANRVAAVIQALIDRKLLLPGSRGPCHNLNVSSTMSLSRALDAREQHYSIALAQAVISESKLELLCEDEHTDAVVELIAEEAKTGQDDAGWIYAATLTHVQHVSGRRALKVKSATDPLQPS
ncbi:MAG: P-II family nitrogen regulator [Burkholderiales bacterium]